MIDKHIPEASASRGTIDSEAEQTCVLNMLERSRISDDEYGLKKESFLIVIIENSNLLYH